MKINNYNMYIFFFGFPDRITRKDELIITFTITYD
jgi:hypothetical protein